MYLVVNSAGLSAVLVRKRTKFQNFLMKNKAFKPCNIRVSIEAVSCVDQLSAYQELSDLILFVCAMKDDEWRKHLIESNPIMLLMK